MTMTMMMERMEGRKRPCSRLPHTTLGSLVHEPQETIQPMKTSGKIKGKMKDRNAKMMNGHKMKSKNGIISIEEKKKQKNERNKKPKMEEKRGTKEENKDGRKKSGKIKMRGKQREKKKKRKEREREERKEEEINDKTQREKKEMKGREKKIVNLMISRKGTDERRRN